MRHYLLGLLYVLENTLPPSFPNANYKCDIIYWVYFMLLRINPTFQMQNTNATLWNGFILWLLEYTIAPLQMKRTNATLLNGVNSWLIENTPLFFKCKVQMRHYLLELFHAFKNTPFSKCTVQIRHYLAGLFYTLENTSPFLNAKYKCDIICRSYFMP